MLPRQVIPGRTLFITRRVSRRALRLIPTPAIRQTLLYCLAHAAEETGVEIHAFIFLGNHYHLIVTDPRGEISLFMQYLNGLSGRIVNCLQGQWENLWASEQASAIPLETAEDVLFYLEYLFLNPVTAGLVEQCHLWPGLHSSPREMLEEKVRVGTRPKVFFSPNTQCPKRVSIRLTLPPVLRERPVEAVEELERRLALRESLKQESMRAKGRKFLGRRGVLGQSPFDTPMSREPRRGRNPQVIGKNKWARIAAIQDLVTFRREYAECREKFRAGDRDVMFPVGTYGPPRVYGARVNQLLRA